MFWNELLMKVVRFMQLGELSNWVNAAWQWDKFSFQTDGKICQKSGEALLCQILILYCCKTPAQICQIRLSTLSVFQLFTILALTTSYLLSIHLQQRYAGGPARKAHRRARALQQQLLKTLSTGSEFRDWLPPTVYSRLSTLSLWLSLKAGSV